MKTAIVVGSGITGLAAAKALQDRYKVKIISPRMAPQGDHLHVLLKTGQLQLEALFPGILEKLKGKGCPEIDWAADTIWETASGVFPRYNSGIKTFSFSRRLLETLMLEDLDAEFIAEEFTQFSDYHYDLLVLAPGANFPLEKFVPSKIVDLLNINLTYRSSLQDRSDLSQYYYQIDPPISRIGKVRCPIENNKMIVTEIDQHSKGFRKKSTFRRIVDFGQLPANVFILGDVLASMNPVFGQGMTVGLLQAGLLQKAMAPSDFHVAVMKISRLPFLLSHIGSREGGVLKFLLRTYLRLCQYSPKLHYRFLKLLHYDSFTSVSGNVGPDKLQSVLHQS